MCGYRGGRLDRWVGRIVDVLMAFPLFVLAMAMVAALGNSVENIVIATVSSTCRSTVVSPGRGERAARDGLGGGGRAWGATPLPVLLRYLLPNILPAMVVQASLNLGWAILNAAGLSFIGLGVRPPTPEWGIMVPKAPASSFPASGGRWCFPVPPLMLAVLLLQPARRRAAGPPGPADGGYDRALAIEDLSRRLPHPPRHGRGAATTSPLPSSAAKSLGVVGESGSGKSVTSLAVMRLLDPRRADRRRAGAVSRTGISRAPGRELRRCAGRRCRMIFQNPRAALNPIRSVEQQIVDVLRAHRRISGSDARTAALDLLRAVQIRDPEKPAACLPGELSGGMCQRVMIAMAIACEPALLIADEPTTGLDVTTQKIVMDLLAGITADRGMAMILITHDLGLAARYCGEIAVMERGLIVERGPTEALFQDARHPYTRRLIAASPTRHRRWRIWPKRNHRRGWRCSGRRGPGCCWTCSM